LQTDDENILKQKVTFQGQAFYHFS